MNLAIAYSVLVLLLASWAMACADCPGCGGCVEPTGGTPNSSHCTPADATSGYNFCIWPAVSGQGCAPGGSCQRFANQHFCLKWVSDSLWQTTRFSVDCSTTYGVTVDIQWQLTVDASANAALVAYAYLTGTNTVVATIVTYAGIINLSACNTPFSVGYVSDNGSCQNWARCVVIKPLCCASCDQSGGGCNGCTGGPIFNFCCDFGADPPQAYIYGLENTVNGPSGLCSDAVLSFASFNRVSMDWQQCPCTPETCFNGYSSVHAASFCAGKYANLSLEYGQAVGSTTYDLVVLMGGTPAAGYFFPAGFRSVCPPSIPGRTGVNPCASAPFTLTGGNLSGFTDYTFPATLTWKWA